MNTDRNAHSINDFCKKFSISRSMFYKLARDGKGPRQMKIGRRTLISSEAIIEWQKTLEYRHVKK